MFFQVDKTEWGNGPAKASQTCIHMGGGGSDRATLIRLSWRKKTVGIVI